MVGDRKTFIFSPVYLTGSSSTFCNSLFSYKLNGYKPKNLLKSESFFVI